MMSLMNTSGAANMSVFLAEDVCAPELRNPMLSGMSKTGKKLFGFLFRNPAARK